MLSQFYLDQVIMSKENSRTFEHKRSNKSNESNKDSSRQELNFKEIVNGTVSRSNIDFLKNLSQNILSVKNTESEFSYRRSDSYNKRYNNTTNTTSSSSGVYDEDCSSISSFEFIKPEDARCSSRRQKDPDLRKSINRRSDPELRKSKILLNDSFETNSKFSSRESSIDKNDRKNPELRKSITRLNESFESNSKFSSRESSIDKNDRKNPELRKSITRLNDSFESNSKFSSRESSIDKNDRKNPELRKSITRLNDSFESNSKFSSPESSIDRNDRKSKKKISKENNECDSPRTTSKNEGLVLSPRLLEPSKINTGSRKQDYNDRHRYEKFKHFHDNTESNSLERRSHDSDDSHEIRSNGSDDSVSIERNSNGSSPSRSNGRFVDSRRPYLVDKELHGNGDSLERTRQPIITNDNENNESDYIFSKNKLNNESRSRVDIRNRSREIDRNNDIDNNDINRNHPSRNQVIDNDADDDGIEHIYENLYFDHDRTNNLEIEDDMIRQKVKTRSHNGVKIRDVIPNRPQHDYACFTIESSSSASSSDSSDLETIDEWKRMDSIFKHINPFILVEYLNERVKERDFNTLQHLSTLLPKSKFTGNTSHCVRCHKEYDPVHGDMECVLYHNEKDVDLISHDNECALFQCERCFTVFKLYGEFEYTKLNAVKCGPCFTGVHTSVADEVVYEPDGVAKKCVDTKGCSSVFYV